MATVIEKEKSSERIFNFGAGPAILPEPVLEEAQRDLLSLPGVGMSILEISHRSKTFEEILEGAIADIRRLAAIPPNYRILFLGGGASLQFSMVPMNLLAPDRSADYVVTGSWSKKAVKEAKKVGGVSIAATTEAEGFARIPDQSELELDPQAAYLHFTTNNTIYGTEWATEPDAGAVPLVADASSDVFSRPIDVGKYALLYAGAQKNLGPSGVTLVILREDLLSRSPKTLPTMLDYNTHAENNSLYNTPPVFAIYVVRLIVKWMLAEGGLEAIGRAQRGEGEGPLRRARLVRRLLPAAREAGQPVEHERDVPPAVGGPREGVPRAGRQAGLLGSEGPPVGRRHPRVDLQRVPEKRGRGAGRLPEGVRPDEGLDDQARPLRPPLRRVGPPGARKALHSLGHRLAVVHER